ncbi:hypothetical protein FQA39_LY07492 [Lamprigera yunnana]|nr:hypothetical protein FQA39_LY07492 [Lamprigera yunnana]
MPLDVIVECLDNAYGIANTMKTNKATYHNGCRALFRSGMLQRQLKKREMDSANVRAAVSLKKTRLSYKATLVREKAQCFFCEKYEGEGDEQIYRVSSANCGKNLFEWALQSQNWVVHARLNTTSNAEDAQAWDTHYHASCYTKLKTEARAATKSLRSTLHQQTYDPIITAQLLALVKCNNSPQNVSQMKKMTGTRSMMATSFIFPKTICAAFVDTARTQVTEDEADQIVDVAGLLKKYIIFNKCLSMVHLAQVV